MANKELGDHVFFEGLDYVGLYNKETGVKDEEKRAANTLCVLWQLIETTMAFDFKKECKELYRPKNRPEIVDVPNAIISL